MITQILEMTVLVNENNTKQMTITYQNIFTRQINKYLNTEQITNYTKSKILENRSTQGQT